MEESNLTSNAQQWELEIVCKNTTYLNAVVKAILKYKRIDFQVIGVNSIGMEERYVVSLWCSWFSNLSLIAKDLYAIEKKQEKI